MSFVASIPALADLDAGYAPPSVSGLDDDALLTAKRQLAELRRRIDATDAVISAEIAHRSRPELGYSGLAQRTGARTPERLIQTLTGVSVRQARTEVRVGALMAATAQGSGGDESATPAAASGPVWLREVADAVSAATLSIDAADAIASGLGSPDDHVSADGLRVAAVELLRLAPSLTLEQLAARAREMRAGLDATRVAERERALRERRYLHLIRQADGMTRLSGLLDPESAALVTDAFDAITSPRRGGPRFVDSAAVAEADALERDPRTTEQVALDSFVELIRAGSLADTSVFVGGRRPAVRVLVTAEDLAAGSGMGFLEGQTEPISIPTVERHACEAGTIPILFDNGDVLRLGRERRLFSRRQRIALAARDGGCVWPGCDRPPSWCEAHHTNQWARDGGRTDIDEGVLLCCHHHMLVHDNDWQIVRLPAGRRDGAVFALVPPSTIDPARTPRPLVPRSAAARRLREHVSSRSA